jgi:ABC-type Na+ efflux pump permease subunit
MTHPIWLLAKIEVVRAIRTGALLRSFLRPVLLGPPAAIAIGTMVSTYGVLTPVVAVPPDLPVELGLELALEEQGFTVVVVDDPFAAWGDDEADAAVVRVVEGDGLAAARAPERATRWRWSVWAVAEREGDHEKVEDAIQAAGRRAVESVVSAVGGDPIDDVRLAWVSQVEAPSSDVPLAIVLGYLVFGLSLPVYYVYGVAGGGDQADGVTEGLLSAGVSARHLAASRWLAACALSVLFAVVLFGQVLVFGGRSLMVLAPPAADLARVVGAVALVDAAFVVVGLLARTSREAVQFAAIVLMGSGVTFALGAAAAAPAWLPLAGAASDAPSLAAWIGAVVHALSALAVVFGAGTLLDRFPRRLLGEGR